MHPNYGRNQPDFGGPREWCGNVIRQAFRRAGAESGCRLGSGKRKDQALDLLVQRLMRRFEGREGYALHADVEEFFTRLRTWKEKRTRRRDTGGCRFDDAIVGIISNSDDRVSSVLSSLGLRVAAGHGDIDFVVCSY